ncbi:MAG TPA: DUF488 family protein [Thermoanaerobaculia bacterium]|nr:DUF488 family protein [Thermoanaerobaculia bacterium]
MSIRIVRLGEPRLSEEGIRLGTVRRPPRGVKKEDYSRLDYYDLWLPDLSPSAELVSLARSESATEKDWAKFVKSYRREMKQPGPERLLQLLALLSRQTNFSVGCYCEREDHCHRSILRELLVEHGAEVK